jgi:predicted RNA binding protein YcfA (HicA-like mRNA interferase family)
MDSVSPPLDLQAEWERVQREYFEKRDSPERQRLWIEGEKLKQEIKHRYLDTLSSACWISLDESSTFQSAQWADLAQRPEELAQQVEHALAERDYALASDGKYRVRLLTDLLRDTPGILVEYAPRTAVPPFVECLTIAKRRLPRAFRAPLIHNVYRPDRALPKVIKIDSSVWSELDNLQTPLVTEELLNTIEANTEAREQARKVIRVKGTETLGWYQSFHKYDESVWGIYLDDHNISHVALDLRDRLAEANANGYADYAKALRAMIWLVAAHERFHAQVDAAALLRELASSKPCFRSYFRHVYQQTINQPTALEEALANYEALRFVQQRLQHLVALKRWTEEERTVSLKFIHDLFEASPPGYADFSKGADYLNWRRLTTQVFDGRLDSVEPLPPVEGLLTDIPGMVFKGTDIPVYMTYRTSLADALTWCPPRRIAEKVLRSNGFEAHPERGKGSHVLWKNKDGRTFPLPRTDRLSIGVFTNLCRKLGTNKQEFQSLISE